MFAEFKKSGGLKPEHAGWGEKNEKKIKQKIEGKDVSMHCRDVSHYIIRKYVVWLRILLAKCTQKIMLLYNVKNQIRLPRGHIIPCEQHCQNWLLG